MACHNATEPYNGTGSAFKRHGDVLKAFNDTHAMSVKFSDIGTDATGKITFKVQVLDGNGSALAQEFVDLSSRVVVAWDSDKDYPAYNDASYSNRRIALSEGTYDAATKTFTLTGTKFDLPLDANGKTFELWSALKVCFNNGGYGVASVEVTDCSTDGVQKIEPKTAPYHFVWNNDTEDTTATAATRREIIDPAKCQGCHNQQIHHYDNGVNCQTCHTSDKTLKSDADYPGGKIPTSFAFKAHEREGHYLKYAGVQSGTVLKTDCSTCHTDNGIRLGRAPDRVWRFGDIANNGADIWVSSDAGTCLSCHQKYLNDASKAHIETNGGILNGSSETDVRTRASETCSTCHSPTQLRSVHGN